MALKYMGYNFLLSVVCILWIYLPNSLSYFDSNFTLQNIWGRLPQSGLRSMIQCISSDENPSGIKFSRKIDTGQGSRVPKFSQQFFQGKPVFARIFLMPSADGLNRFGVYQCKTVKQKISTEIVTLKLPPIALVELDSVQPYQVVNTGDNVELEVVEQKKLNLPVQWRYNGNSEVPEWKGKLKIELSNAQVSDAGVYECYYEGRRKESVHAIMRLIVRSCPANKFGVNCDQTCPSCYNGGICHDKWGVCVCPAGFTGNLCEHACGGNHFGADCSKLCTPPQNNATSMDDGCAFHLFCKPDPYGCSCAPGFKGSTCMDHCEPGWYGADCKQRCHCGYGSSSCNRITGACEGGCAAGWNGESCQIDDPMASPGDGIETTTKAFCPTGSYGPSCEKACHCFNAEPCNVISGKCSSGCEDGWGGNSCTTCKSGRFGDNCEFWCHCEGGHNNCDKEGYCTFSCESGWTGFTCQQECTAGRFGSNCASTCHCKKGPSACDKVTGLCDGDCLPGFMGNDCQTLCPLNTYGVNCMSKCICSNGGQCNRIDGSCACEGRWRGTICNESEPQIVAASDEDINIGQQIYISCTADAVPEPEIKITSSKFPISSFHIRRLEKDQFQAVTKIKSDESGDIDLTCTARNQHGFDMKVIILSVIEPPRLIQEPEVSETTNKSIKVTWKKWMYHRDEGGKENDEVEYMVIYRESGSSSWITPEGWKADYDALIENLEPDQEYDVAVKCRRPGKGGEGEPSPYLSVKTDCGDPVPDAIPQQFLPEDIMSTSVKLTWKAPSEVLLRCSLKGYKLKYYLELNHSAERSVKIPDIQDEIELNNLLPNSAYVLHIHTVTELGPSKYFAELIIHTTDEAPGQVRNLQCMSLGYPEELTVKWEDPLTTYTMKGYILTHEVTNKGQCKEIPVGHIDRTITQLTLPSNTEVILSNLLPYSTYLISVKGKSAFAEGPAAFVTCATIESDHVGCPGKQRSNWTVWMFNSINLNSPDIGPPNLRLISKTSRSLEFKWDPIPCEAANGEILEYEYKLMSEESQSSSDSDFYFRHERSLDVEPNSLFKKVKGLQVLLKNLQPYEQYGLAVRAHTKVDAGPFTEFLIQRTDEETPSSPLNLTLVSSSTDQLELSWANPVHPRGKITTYRVSYFIPNEITSSTVFIFITFEESNDVQKKISVNITHLIPATNYVIKVQASTNAGWGDWSSQIAVRTKDGFPEVPSKVLMVSNTKTSMKISWRPPDITNGAITGYEVHYYPVSSLDSSYNISQQPPIEILVGETARSINLIDLHPSTQYSVEIKAKTIAGYGLPRVILCWTVIVGNHIVPNVTALDVQATNESVPIVFSTTGKKSVYKYQVIVEDSRNTDGIEMDRLYDYETGVVKKHLLYYIAAQLDPSNISDSGKQVFLVGDKQIWDGYKNVHLNPGHEYRIRIRTFIENGLVSVLSEPEDMVSASSVVKIKSTSSYEIFGMPIITFILIVASTFVLLTSIIFFTVLGICKRKEKKKANAEFSARNSGLSESVTWSVMYKVSENEAVDGPLVCDGPVSLPINDKTLTLKRQKNETKTIGGIRIENLPEYVNSIVLSSRLVDEFKQLETGQTAPWTVARKSENLKKNRYGNILPYDCVRVVLQCDSSSSDSDYINASYVNGYKRPKEYIVTQGPLESTVIDFWRMVWQEHVPIIVMVTELMENGKKKCFKYWPDDSMVSGKLQILLIHEEQNTDFVIRTILMRSMNEGRTHRVRQYQFSGWPDRTIPSSPCFLLKMMKRMRDDHLVLAGPIIVHCSAGAGRSGTYVALDALCEQAKEEKRVDIFRFVNNARLQRINLVQTLEQYIFIHESLLEAINYEDTSVSLDKLLFYLEELNNTHTLDQRSAIRRQYQLLNKTQRKVDVNNCSVALSERNIFKNRDPMTVPDDETRLKLQNNSDDDYINAILVDSYKEKKSFLVTQTPLHHTVEDFWQLIYQQESSMILMLSDCHGECDLNIGQYWPDKGHAVYGSFEVQLVTFEDQGEVVIRILKLINHLQIHAEPHKIIQLQYKSWPQKQQTPSSPTSFLKFLHLVNLWHRRSNGRAITVHCLDGATRSGLFCAVSCIYDQMKSEGSLDVYQLAKYIRTNRPEFLPSIEQYAFCFEVANEILNAVKQSFDSSVQTCSKFTKQF